jgi:hypothetical protein
MSEVRVLSRVIRPHNKRNLRKRQQWQQQQQQQQRAAFMGQVGGFAG